MQTSFNTKYLQSYLSKLQYLENSLKQSIVQLDTMGIGQELIYLKQQLQTMLYMIEQQKIIIYTIV